MNQNKCKNDFEIQITLIHFFLSLKKNGINNKLNIFFEKVSS